MVEFCFYFSLKVCRVLATVEFNAITEYFIYQKVVSKEIRRSPVLVSFGTVLSLYWNRI